MIDWPQMYDLIWQGRWDGIVMFASALWQAVVTYWWVGPILLFLLITAKPKALLRFGRYVGTTFWRGGLQE